MDSQDFNQLRTRMHELSLHLPVDDSEGCPSDVVPNGETSPALVFKLFSKGAPLPFNAKYFDHDDSVVGVNAKFSTTPSECYLNMRDELNRVRARAAAAAAAAAAAPAAAAPAVSAAAAPAAAASAAAPAAASAAASPA